MEKQISQKELNERSYKSKAKTDQIMITVPKGTKNMIIEMTGERPSTFCNKIVLEYIKKLSKE